MALQRLLASAALAADAEFVDSMRRLGATSPAAACAHRDLPKVERERFNILLDLGVLREAAPGTYYLFEHASALPVAQPLMRAVGGRRVWISLLFWLAMILIPVALIRYMARS